MAPLFWADQSRAQTSSATSTPVPESVTATVPPSEQPVVQSALKSTPQPNVKPATQMNKPLVRRPAQQAPKKKVRQRLFGYSSISYFSFADQIYAKVAGVKTRARSIFTGYALGGDLTLYRDRMIYTLNLNLMTGHVDVQRVGGVTYPRKSFWGVQSGPEIGLRVNPDFDFTYGFNLLYRDVESLGPSFALSNQLNVKFRLTPRLTLFQSLGNYGKPTSYSYGLGLRLLL